jgi:hypothetical protein
VIALQIADPTSRQRGRPIDTRPQISESNTPTGSNIWSQVPQGCLTQKLTGSRKVTSNYSLEEVQCTYNMLEINTTDNASVVFVRLNMVVRPKQVANKA